MVISLAVIQFFCFWDHSVDLDLVFILNWTCIIIDKKKKIQQPQNGVKWCYCPLMGTASVERSLLVNKNDHNYMTVKLSSDLTLTHLMRL